MAKSRVYKIEVSVEDNYVTLRPCKVEIAYSGEIPFFKNTGDYEAVAKSHTLRFPINKKNAPMLDFLIYKGWDMRSNWDGYIGHVWSEVLSIGGNAPDRLRKWARSLPVYEVRMS